MNLQACPGRRVHAMWLLGWTLRGPQQFSSVGHSVTWQLFSCLQQRHERSCSSFHKEGFILTRTDVVYRRTQYRLKPIRYASLDASIWCLPPCVADSVTEELIGGVVVLATWLHRISDCFLRRVVLAWGFVWLLSGEGAIALTFPKIDPMQNILQPLPLGRLMFFCILTFPPKGWHLLLAHQRTTFCWLLQVLVFCPRHLIVSVNVFDLCTPTL